MNNQGQPQQPGQQLRNIGGPMVQPAPQRKTFDVNSYPHAASTPSFVSGTPDWVKPYIQKAAAKYNFPAMVLSAQLKQESGFNPKAGSGAGAQGIAQFMPSTAKGLGVNPWDPESAIMGQAQLMRHHMDKYGDLKLALAAYNAGGGAVNQYGGVPPYPETQNYVKNIISMAGEPHQSANGPLLDTINQIKKTGQMPQQQVMGASTQAPAPTAPPTNMANPYKNFVAPIPASQEVLPFQAPVPQDQVLMGNNLSSADAAIAKIRHARPNLSLSDQQLRQLYTKYGDRLLTEL